MASLEAKLYFIFCNLLYISYRDSFCTFGRPRLAKPKALFLTLATCSGDNFSVPKPLGNEYVISSSVGLKLGSSCHFLNKILTIPSLLVSLVFLPL